jgi:Transposase DDE domain
MSHPKHASILGLYEQVITASCVKSLQQQTGGKVRRGIYCARVVVWMMMLQRLYGTTLAGAVQMLIQGAAQPLLEHCWRVECWNVCSRTGGYCRARGRLSKLLCREVSQQILQQLRQMLDPAAGHRPSVFTIDGTSLELEHAPELLRAYPVAENQHGKSHWPVLRVVVAHELNSGLAESPCWGPMYGKAAVSEQELAEKMMGNLPAGATIVGDRNFGVFWMAYAAQQQGLGVVLRLTKERAHKLAGAISQAGEQAVVWKSSRHDGGKQRSFPPEAQVRGRLIATRIGRGQSQQWLYLFTTVNEPWQQMVDLYGRRAEIETDLRCLKRTVNLHHIQARSVDMMEKELLIAMSAYNLVRAVMTMAAQRYGIAPRQLSFSGVLNVVYYALPNLLTAPVAQQEEHLERILERANQCRLPVRRKPRSYPRSLWRHRPAFPTRPSEKSK